MRFLFRLIPILLGLVSLGAFGLLSIFGLTNFFLIVGMTAVILAYLVFELLGRRLREKDFWSVLLLLLLIEFSGIAFYILLEHSPAKLFTALLTALLVGFFAEQIYRWFYVAARVPSYALTVAVSLLEVVTIFYLASSFVGFRVLLRLPLFILLPVFFLFVALIVIFGQWARGAEKTDLLRAGLVGLLAMELMWAVLFLPSSFEVGGALIVLGWYVIIGLLRVFESGLRVRRAAIRYAAVGTILLIVIISFARWV